MKRRTLVLLLVPLVLSACARFGTQQFDERLYERFNETTGKLIERERTRISTEAGTSTVFDSDSALANFKAAQTEKSQTATVGSLNQSASGTNAVELLKELNKLLAR